MIVPPVATAPDAPGITIDAFELEMVIAFEVVIVVLLFITSELDVVEMVADPVVGIAVFAFWTSELAVFVIVILLLNSFQQNQNLVRFLSDGNIFEPLIDTTNQNNTQLNFDQDQSLTKRDKRQELALSNV